MLVELAGVRFLTDPLLRERVAHLRRRVALTPLRELLPLDAILISHAHADHLDVPSLRRISGECPAVVPRGCATLVKRARARRVVELAAGARCSVRGVDVEAVEARHDGRRHPLSRRSPALGFLLDGPTRVYFAGDTDLFEAMALLAGRVDVALLPVWGWGPRLPPGHLDPESAARAVALIRPAVAVPIHWGTLQRIGARAPADPRAPAWAFAAAVERLAPTTHVRILTPGARMALAAGA